MLKTGEQMRCLARLLTGLRVIIIAGGIDDTRKCNIIVLDT